jgi:hypothetical protein
LPPLQPAAPGKAGLGATALDTFAHERGLHGGFIGRRHREGLLAAALFEAEANEAGRVKRDDDAAILGAVAVKFFTGFLGRELIKGGWSRFSSGNGPFAGDQISAQTELVRSRPS